MASISKFEGVERMVATLDAWAAVLAKKGLSTSHLLRIAVLDLKCRLFGVSDHELDALLARLPGENEMRGLSLCEDDVHPSGPH